MAVLAGCSGSQPPMGAPGSAQQSDTTATHARGLLYATAIVPSGIGVDEYTYPRGEYVQQLKPGFFAALVTMCVDAVGILFVVAVAGNSSILEYAHGGSKPIKSLRDRRSPMNCSVDPTTGNLVVMNYGSVSIYRKAGGTPTVYRDPQIAHYRSSSYDDQGNLFLDDFNGEGKPQFAELPRGSSAFTNISIRPRIDHPAKVQWDGTHFAIVSNGARSFIGWPSRVHSGRLWARRAGNAPIQISSLRARKSPPLAGAP
jgi:hypothetical protein